MSSCPDPQWECAGPEATHVDVRDGELPSEAVLRAVADVTGRDLLALSPLYAVVDPDAVDAIFRHRPAGGSSETILRFVYEERGVCVTHDEVRVCAR